VPGPADLRVAYWALGHPTPKFLHLWFGVQVGAAAAGAVQCSSTRVRRARSYGNDLLQREDAEASGDPPPEEHGIGDSSSDNDDSNSICAWQQLLLMPGAAMSSFTEQLFH
jgi:hypothetical protein